ncbi:hypothetical protein ACHAWF_005658 [Thalassiosira exigua]
MMMNMNYLSRWLDHKRQKLKPFYNYNLLENLKDPGSLNFTVNANLMYTNINTDHAIKVIGTYLDSLDLNNNYPLGAVKEAMVLAMKNNIFEWGICTSCSSWELQWVCQQHTCGLLSTVPSTKWDYTSQNMETI